MKGCLPTTITITVIYVSTSRHVITHIAVLDFGIHKSKFECNPFLKAPLHFVCISIIFVGAGAIRNKFTESCRNVQVVAGAAFNAKLGYELNVL